MKFFTKKGVQNKYLLIKIKDYIKLKDFLQWDEILIDPGVYELIKSASYSWEGHINIIEFLNALPLNHYFAADYPCDMNLQHTDLFLDKSWKNALQYHNHSNYIVTVQSRFNDYISFVEWFNKYNNLEIKSGILGLGNICRIHYLTDYIKHSLGYAFKFCNHPRIHIYGLGLRIIPFAYKLSKKYKIDLSFDNTKWTRSFHTHGEPSCNAKNMQLYFNEFWEEVQKRTEKEREKINEITRTIY